MSARFVTSATTPSKLPPPGFPEFAFIGRSNVGKSSLIGTLLGKPKLVRTSRTPGRTQLLNLFELDERFAIVDLPGYGYAKLSKNKRHSLDRMVRDYLAEREGLLGVVQVVDGRREPVSEYDRYVASWIVEQGRLLLVAVTKLDLVPKNRRKARISKIEAQLGLPEGASLGCSSKTGEGRRELYRRLEDLAEGPQAGAEQ